SNPSSPTNLGRRTLRDEQWRVALRIATFVIPLGFDTFAVAVALGLRGLYPLRPALLFTLFETAMPLFGLVVGRYVGLRFGALAVYIGAIIIIGLGVHTLRETLADGGEAGALSFESVRGILLAGSAISTDEIAMGFPLGALGLPIVVVLAAIAAQGFFATVTGILIGRRIGTALGRRTSRIAGLSAGVAFLLLGSYLLVERMVLRAG
ncbi:MAG TPA: manganese efflux pump, partial [bacterium]|nr:manganese efflux pump [bacterium]